MIIVSACLAGEECRYDGKANTIETIKELVAKGEALPVCPEVLGGLPTPRTKSECIGHSKVVSETGEDVTMYFVKGAEATLEIGEKHGANKAILKAKSPSCGCRCIYDGTFSGKLILGEGVTAALLRKNGYKLVNEVEFIERGI